MKTRIVMGLLAALLAAGVVVSITDTEDDVGHHHRTLTVTLGGPGHKEVALPPAAQAIAKSQRAQDAAGKDEAAESDLHGEKQLSGRQERRLAADTPPGQVRIPPHLPLASPSVIGCRSYPVRNNSSRDGAPILIGVTHWTASRDTFPSWSGILGNVRWFDQPAAQASSNEIMDSGGQCALTVAEARKAWTQTNYNRVALSAEITNNGIAKPLLRRPIGVLALARLYVGWHDRWNLPLRRARVFAGSASSRACPTVYVTGILEHVDLGACGGGELRRPFPPEAIKFKGQAVVGGTALCVPYIDARLVIERLNHVCGMDWQPTYEPARQVAVVPPDHRRDHPLRPWLRLRGQGARLRCPEARGGPVRHRRLGLRLAVDLAVHDRRHARRQGQS
jgi:hypothetical protein